MASLPLEPSERFLDFRPRDYFNSTLPPDLIRSRVKGQARRDMASALIEKGVAELPDALTEESLEEAERAAAGSIHPLLMSGEYLPDLESREVEIARVILRSTTGDVISVRARREGAHIAYRIVDEYESSEFGPEYSKTASVQPLSLGELLHYMDSCCHVGILTGLVEENLQGGAFLKDMVGFVRAESTFYPDLAAVVDERMDAWVESHRADDDEDEDDDIE